MIARQHRRFILITAFADVLIPYGLRILVRVVIQSIGDLASFKAGFIQTGERITIDGTIGVITCQCVSVRVASFNTSATLRVATDVSNSGS